MSDRKHCDSCQQEITVIVDFVSVYPGGPMSVGHSAYPLHRLEGDYCSIGCLTRKMLTTSPTARAEILAALDIQEPNHA